MMCNVGFACMMRNIGLIYDLQCRVYMVGGAEATGGPNDTAVVYTPAFHEYDDKGRRRVYVWNVTLPQHFFSRAPVNPDQREQTLTPAAISALMQGCLSVCLQLQFCCLCLVPQWPHEQKRHGGFCL